MKILLRIILVLVVIISYSIDFSYAQSKVVNTKILDKKIRIEKIAKEIIDTNLCQNRNLSIRFNYEMKTFVLTSQDHTLKWLIPIDKVIIHIYESRGGLCDTQAECISGSSCIKIAGSYKNDSTKMVAIGDQSTFELAKNLALLWNKLREEYGCERRNFLIDRPNQPSCQHSYYIKDSFLSNNNKCGKCSGNTSNTVCCGEINNNGWWGCTGPTGYNSASSIEEAIDKACGCN